MRLTSHIKLDKSSIESPNLCDRFSVADLECIGSYVHENFVRDKATRADWERRMSSAMDLAMQLQKEKSFPWPNCSNVAFPLVTIAALQFHARAYPAIVNGRSVVQCRVVGGGDAEGIAQSRAERIGDHMSWQLLEQDESWEEDTDRALLNVSIMGSGYKKSYYDAGKGHNISEFVQTQDLVVDYFAKSIESARVKTHIIPMDRNDVRERMLRGTYLDCTEDAWFKGTAPTPEGTQDKDARAGVRPPQEDYDTPFILLEQHCWMDLDGDGYAEPVIVTIEKSSQQVLRIVYRFNRVEDIEYTKKKEVIRIRATEFFTKIPMIPSPDGSILDIGFGALLGPLNDSVNTTINQLLDSGTVSNTAGGFLGRGAKIRGGVYEFKPFGWHRVDATGDDLRKSIFPLPVRDPSAVMFNLLSLLIDYTNRVSGSTDMLVGENPGQNTPAETSRAMLEQGQKIYSAVFKRIWRSLKGEFKKLYNLNALYLPDRSLFGENREIKREDYSATAASVCPVADPTISSDGARFARAQMLVERAAVNPGYNADAVEKQYLKALGVDEVDVLYPGQENMPPPPPDVKLQIQQMKSEIELAKLEQAKTEFILTMQETVRVNGAKILELEAKARQMEEETKALPGKYNIEAFRAGIEAMRERNNEVNAQLDRMMESRNAEQRTSGGSARVEAASGNSAVDALGLPAA